MAAQDLRISALVCRAAHGRFAGELVACLDIQGAPMQPAPTDELIRVKLHPDCLDPAGVEAGFHLLGALLPLIEAGGETAAIGHDLPDSPVIFAAIPDQRRNANAAKSIPQHTPSPCAPPELVDTLNRLFESANSGGGTAGCAPAPGLSSDGPETANPDADTPADPDVLPQLPMGGEDAAAAAACQRETAAAVPAAEPFNPGKAA